MRRNKNREARRTSTVKAFGVIASVIFLLALSAAAVAVECGTIPSDGCTINGDLTLAAGIYHLPHGITFNAGTSSPGHVLDCNGATLVGVESGIGIKIRPSEWFTTFGLMVKNCNIMNYTTGILFSTPNGMKPVRDAIITDNFLSGNTRGIYLSGKVANNLITNNYFSNNTQGIYHQSIDQINNTIAGNVFSGSGIYYVYANDNYYCTGGVGNTYLDGATGPTCNGLYPYNNLIVNLDAKFAPGNYSLPSGIVVQEGHGVFKKKLDCNGATLIGNGTKNGITITSPERAERYGFTIRNCNLLNYSAGIRLSIVGSRTVRLATVVNNTFSNTTKGVELSGRDQSLNTVFSNTFYGGGIFYGYTNNNTYCVNGTGNTYLNSATGPTCEGLYPYDGLIVNTNAVFAPGSYAVPSGIRMVVGSGSSPRTLDCHGAHLFGSGKGNGIQLFPEWHTLPDILVRNCAVSGFASGITFLTNKPSSLTYSINDTLLSELTLFNNTYGIIIHGDRAGGNAITHSSLYDNNYSIYLKTAHDFNAEKNYWGTIHPDVIRGTIYDFANLSTLGRVDFDPFIVNATDTFVSGNGLFFAKTEGRDIEVRALIHRAGLIGDEAAVTFYHLRGGTELIDTHAVAIPPFIGEANATAIFALKDGDVVKVIVEPTDGEPDTGNNDAEKEFSDFPYFYVESSLGPRVAREEIEEYLKARLLTAYPTESILAADIIITVGRDDAANQLSLRYEGWGYEGTSLVAGGRRATAPYAGLVGSFKRFGKRNIYLYGNRVEGIIAAAKEMVLREHDFISVDSAYLIGDENIEAIAVYDYMHTPANDEHYLDNSHEFRQIVNNSLHGMHDDTSFTVATTNSESVTLRLRQLKPLHSEMFLDFTNGDDAKPVVFSGGIFSYILSWYEDDGLAKQLADSGREVWLMEMTGGPGTECDDCPNYSYDDLVDYYWPASIAGILRYSGSDQIDYVGHSNGGRAALSSLNEYSSSGKAGAGLCLDDFGEHTVPCSLPEHPVDRFVGVAVPTTLNDETPLTKSLRVDICSENIPEVRPAICESMESALLNGDYAIATLNSSGMSHVRLFNFGNRLVSHDQSFLISLVTLMNAFSEPKISLSLMDFYSRLGEDTSSTLDLSNVEVNKLYLFNAKPNDVILGVEDQGRILNGTDRIYLSSKQGFNYSGQMSYHHARIVSADDVERDIREVLQ